MLTKKILVIDDSAFISEYIARVLSQAGYQTFLAADGLTGLKRVKEVAPDLILLDIILPDMEGFEVCRILRADQSNNLRPIIILSSQQDEEDKLKGLELGADDYITKPFNDRELLSRVRNTLRRIDRNRYANPLTGLEGNLRIESEISSRLSQQEHFAVLYADLDNFKAFNDFYGYAKGDMAIQLTAGIITNQVSKYGSPNDFVGHVGGDDFVVVIKPESVDQICSEIIHEFDLKIRSLYSGKQLEEGCITVQDRNGNLKRYPLMTISIAAVTNEHRTFESHLEISEIAAELKRKAKTMDGSKYLKDNRKS